MQLSADSRRRLAAARDILAVALFCALAWLGWRALVNSPHLQKERLVRREAEEDAARFHAALGSPGCGETLKALEGKYDEFDRVTVRDLAWALYAAGARHGGGSPLWRPRLKWKDPDPRFPPFTLDRRGGAFVIENANDAALKGAGLAAIEGTPAEAFLAPVLERVPGADREARAGAFCRDQAFWWDFSGLAAGKQALALSLRRDGKAAARTAAPVTAFQFRSLLGQVYYWREPVQVIRGTAWAALGAFDDSWDWKGEYRRIFGGLRRNKAPRLVLDLRRSAGYDPRPAERLLEHVTEGKGSFRTSLLIGPGTAGAAALFAAEFRARGLGEVYGEPASGPACGFRREKALRLPNSGIRFAVPAGGAVPCPEGVLPVPAEPSVRITGKELRNYSGDPRLFLLDTLAKK